MTAIELRIDPRDRPVGNGQVRRLLPHRTRRMVGPFIFADVTGFGPYPDSWIAWAADDAGAAIEVYPVDTEMFPPTGPQQAQFRHNP